ncbi:MAG: HPr family phosphocarrier protein [Pseudomonadales bacterium]|nr:HPr family phosphocarrier protein [Pseudomonadales bacterium]MBO6566019.1 HPr family phosphocarrier protein [Pseudomonadales bacterium]MBO6594224.1 HPr family phosphocarrier protein [Pseudomonadales bacterium]MBO6656313.1 HPr family phosphocarrier protein [Pseudomonadales bacterium]MBO6700723.1 HPr family phosphocarrier protein [Pseudomonadales bacterium]
MIIRNLQIQNKLGLHARAASVFVKTAGAFASQITVRSSQKEANGKSIMSMMMLEAALGARIQITVEGDDETQAMEAIEQLIADKFGENE